MNSSSLSLTAAEDKRLQNSRLHIPVSSFVVSRSVEEGSVGGSLLSEMEVLLIWLFTGNLNLKTIHARNDPQLRRSGVREIVIECEAGGSFLLESTAATTRIVNAGAASLRAVLPLGPRTRFFGCSFGKFRPTADEAVSFLEPSVVSLPDVTSVGNSVLCFTLATGVDPLAIASHTVVPASDSVEGVVNSLRLE